MSLDAIRARLRDINSALPVTTCPTCGTPQRCVPVELNGTEVGVRFPCPFCGDTVVLDLAEMRSKIAEEIENLRRRYDVQEHINDSIR